MFAIQLQQLGDIEVGSTDGSYKDSKLLFYIVTIASKFLYMSKS